MSKYIWDYESEGFEKVCNVKTAADRSWKYHNINRELMFSPHNSWVYFIVDNFEIVKIGETGNPLGIWPKNKNSAFYELLEEVQPITGTTGRLGRLRGMKDNTDGWIRNCLYESAKRGHISIWAKKCEIIEKITKIGGIEKTIFITSHKHQEVLYLDHVKNTTGDYPRLNEMRK
jgi:hypothetical protein